MKTACKFSFFSEKVFTNGLFCGTIEDRLPVREQFRSLSKEIFMNDYYYVVPEGEPVQDTTPVNPQDPFENETEFHEYQCDYGEILPAIRLPGTHMTRLPGTREKSRIRRFHNIVGAFLAGHFVASNVIAVFMIVGIELLFKLSDMAATGGNLPADYSTLVSDYFSNSSSILAVNTLIYGLCNVLIAVFGCKATKIRIPELFQTKDLRVLQIIGYIGVALLIQVAMGYSAVGITELFEGVGITLYEPDFGDNTSPRFLALSFCYSVIVAPITEELLMRGFVLKNLSRTNQRFGIMMSAFLFGIWHENLAQFLLAFTAGCFFGYIAVKHNSLVPSIICHMAVNLCAELATDCENLGLDIASAVLDIAYLLMVVIGLGMLIYLLVTERFPRTTPAQAERGLRITLTSPLMLLVCVCHIGATVIYILSASKII